MRWCPHLDNKRWSFILKINEEANNLSLQKQTKQNKKSAMKFDTGLGLGQII
jgi:hypothetical protein